MLFAKNSTEYWRVLRSWVILIDPMDAFPLEHALKYQDADDDIVQSAAVGMHITKVCEAFDAAWRYQLAAPDGTKWAEGTILTPKRSTVIAVRYFMSDEQRTLSVMRFQPESRLTVKHLAAMTHDGRRTGQLAACLTTGNMIPVDHQMFEAARN